MTKISKIWSVQARTGSHRQQCWIKFCSRTLCGGAGMYRRPGPHLSRTQALTMTSQLKVALRTVSRLFRNVRHLQHRHEVRWCPLYLQNLSHKPRYTPKKCRQIDVGLPPGLSASSACQYSGTIGYTLSVGHATRAPQFPSWHGMEKIRHMSCILAMGAHFIA